jgi:hypothetical protein
MLFAISGWISGFGIEYMDQAATSAASGWQLNFGPGIWFGLASAVIFNSYFAQRIGGFIVWMITTLVAWYVAFQIFMISTSFGKDDYLIPLGIAGAAGGILLALTFKGLTKKVRFDGVPKIAFVGGLSGIAMLPFIDQAHGNYPLAFIIWQISVGIALLLWMPRRSFINER